MGFSHKNGIALAGVSHLDGIAKAGLSHIGGQLIGSAAAGYLFTENFEATGFDTAGWAKLGTGTINEDYSTAGLDMEGSQCLRIAAASQTPNLTWGTFTPSGELWFYTQYRLVSITTASVVFLTIRDASVLTLRVRMGNTGLFGLLITGVSVVNATVAITPGVTYHVWVHYKKGTGANAIARLAWSTDGIKPTSGSQFIEILTGTATNNLDRLAIGNSVSHVKEYMLDKMRVSATEIGNNPDSPSSTMQDFVSYAAGVSLATLPGWTASAGSFLTVAGGTVYGDTTGIVNVAAFEPSGFTTAANHQVEVQLAGTGGGSDAHGAACAIQADGSCYHCYADTTGNIYFGYAAAGGSGSDWMSDAIGSSSDLKIRMTVSGTGASRVCTASYNKASAGWVTPSGWANRDFGSGKRLDGGKGGLAGFNNTHTVKIDSVIIRNQ